jgi:hypothetical protein
VLLPRVKVSGLPSGAKLNETSPPLIVCPPGPLLPVSVAVIFGGSGGLQEGRSKSPAVASRRSGYFIFYQFFLFEMRRKKLAWVSTYQKPAKTKMHKMANLMQNLANPRRGRK